MNTDCCMDLHTHTIASGHAYNTINEMIRSASEKKVTLLGITEHGPAMPGSTNKYYFQNLNILEREKYGVHILYGAELNIVDYNGTTDLDERSWRDLDYCIASLHYNCLTPGTQKENTFALLHAMEHPKVHIIGHPDDGHFPLDYELLVKEAKSHHVLLELNNSSFNPKGFRMHARENDVEVLRLCEKYDMPIIINSDAHREEDVASFSFARTLIADLNFPQELIVNNSLEFAAKWIPALGKISHE